MKPEAQRIAIAEACGWTKVWPDKGTGQMEFHSTPVPLPDYLNDLNAMHEAEKVLDSDQWDHYCTLLDQMPGPAISATAPQRAEAFLRTLNLWKD